MLLRKKNFPREGIRVIDKRKKEINVQELLSFKIRQVVCLYKSQDH